MYHFHDFSFQPLSLGIAIICTLIPALYRHMLMNAARAKPDREHHHTPPKNPVALSLRFRDIPDVFDERTFREALDGSARGSIVGLSWTKSALTESTYTACACFSSQPSFLKDSSEPSGVNTTVVLNCERGKAEIRVDDQFHGMTPLYWLNDRSDVE